MGAAPSPLDQLIPRQGTGSVKWEASEGAAGHGSSLAPVENPDVIPMWVADMDFACPSAVIEAIRQRAEHPIFGYTVAGPSFFESLSGWMLARHGFGPDPGWMTATEGVVGDLRLLVRALVAPGQGVIVHSPVYYPFYGAIRNGGGRIVSCPLRDDGGESGVRPEAVRGNPWRLDFERFEELAAQPENRMTFLSNPHNPVGRVWSREELSRVARIAARRRLIVVSDEIHGDLVLEGHRFVPFLSLGAADPEITLASTAASKTFNLAGLKTSCLIAPNPDHRRRFQRVRDRTGAYGVNPFGAAASEAGWRRGGPWLDRVLRYLAGSARLLSSFFAERPELGVGVTPLEGTYLAWLDCRKTGIPPPRLERFLLDRAQVRLKDGALFGPEGRGFVRMNLACPRPLLHLALTRIARALKVPR